MPGIHYKEIEERFSGNVEDAFEYFILVESYEKHLSGEQKDNFLNASKIENMFGCLSDKQLRHLKSLVAVFLSQKFRGHLETNPNMGYNYGGDGLSKWFVDELYENELVKQKECVKKSIGPIVFCMNTCRRLIDRITKFEEESGRAQKYIHDIVEKYKSKLKKFDGNSIEYRKWLILSIADHGIPYIEKTYDVTKLLKQLSIDHLRELKWAVKWLSDISIIIGIRYLEPYFYWLATKSINTFYDDPQTGKGSYYPVELQLTLMQIKDQEISESKLKRNLCKGNFIPFKNAKKDLISEIKDIIKKKQELILSKVDGLSKSTTFGRDMEEILRSISDVDEEQLKDTIQEYCMPFAQGDAFNLYLRKTVFLRALLHGTMLDRSGRATPITITSVSLDLFRHKIAKVYEYFRKHLTDKEYTVYRGMRDLRGLVAMLKVATPRIVAKIDDMDAMLTEINTKKPVIFEDGFSSTSLNKGVSSTEFHGREGVLFIIKVPRGSQALVLDYEEIVNAPHEEEVLLAPRTKMKINSIEKVDRHYEITATVLS